MIEMTNAKDKEKEAPIIQEEKKKKKEKSIELYHNSPQYLDTAEQVLQNLEGK